MYRLFNAVRPVVLGLRSAAIVSGAFVAGVGLRSTVMAESNPRTDFVKRNRFHQLPDRGVAMLVTIPAFLEQFSFDASQIRAVWNNESDTRCTFHFPESTDRAKVKALSAQITKRGIKNQFKVSEFGCSISLDVGVSELRAYSLPIKQDSETYCSWFR